jgi:pimeloyl-ACP methyl ester carboxylesterase
MRIRLCFVFVFSLALHAGSPPPVILVDGWYPNCATAPRSSTSTFGQLEAKLNAMGITTQYFRPCSVPVQSSYARATIEELGQALGTLIEQTIRQTKAPQVDVIAFSMGSPTVRAYLSGKQNARGVFQPPEDHKVRKVVFLGGYFFGVGNGHAPTPDPQDDALCIGTPLQWDLNTWNQGGDDLRGIDAIAPRSPIFPTVME